MYKGLIYYSQLRSVSTNMLKARARATELLARRADDKKKVSKYTILNQADFQVIGASREGCVPSLLVNSEGNSYLFNCGAGFQRFCFTKKIKLVKLENLFITNLEWNQVSGVPGLSLTLQDVGAVAVCVHGSDGIDGFFESTNSFMAPYSGISLSTNTDCSKEYKDSGITIKKIPLDESSFHENSDESLKRTKCNSKLVAYYCSLPDLPGSLDPEKCRALKVPLGPDLARLKSGQDVTLADGRVIKSSDVVNPANLGSNFVVIECPSLDKLDSILTNKNLSDISKYRYSREERQVDMVFHFSPEDVIKEPKYREWMDNFGFNCRHILLSNSDVKKIHFFDSYCHQYLLNQLDNKIFPTLYFPESLTNKIEQEAREKTTHNNETSNFDTLDPSEEEEQVVEVDLNLLPNVYKPDSLDKIVVRPTKVLQKVEENIEVDYTYQVAKRNPYFDQLHDDLIKMRNTVKPSHDYEPEVVFLGTGSAIPGKYRNTSCILLNFSHPKTRSVILDCGEDSFGQLFRFYGPVRVQEILKQLKLIYISHHHADHHVGLIELIKQRKRLTSEPLTLLIPPDIQAFLEYHDKNFEDLGNSYKLISTKDLRGKPFQGSPNAPIRTSAKSELMSSLDGLLDDVRLVSVEHCRNACAVVMNFHIGHQDMKNYIVSYSGDARPSEDFCLAGRDCDLLIHEATFDYRSQSDAINKKHCTSTEAIMVGKQMRAKFTILTHFSARLPKIPYFTEEFDESVGFAFDNLCLKCPSDFSRLPMMKPLLSNVFKESLYKIDNKFLKTEIKKQIRSDVIKNHLADAEGS